jgi:small subunit ribosomal protein S17
MTDAKKVKILTGEVTSAFCDKTITVLVSSIKSHKLYKKNYTVSKKIKAHDEKNEYKIGDIVEISPIRPVSKDKSYIVVKKVK